MHRQAFSSISQSKYLQQTRRLMLPTTGVMRLVCLFFISILFTLWIVNSSVTAKSLFQSPASPVSPPAQQSDGSAPQEPSTQQPAAEQPPVDQGAGVESISPVLPAEGANTAPVTPEDSLSETSRPTRDRDSRDSADEAAESPNFILDEVELIDSVVVSGAYLWLCCGVILFLLVPMFMLVLYIRGRSKMGQDEGY